MNLAGTCVKCLSGKCVWVALRVTNRACIPKKSGLFFPRTVTPLSMKKILTYTGISLLVLIILAVLLPVLFKGRIVNLVKNEINKSLLAKVEFSDIDISLLRHFPK